MKFRLRKTSDWKYESEIEINTLEELINFINKEGEGKIVMYDNEIEIYNDYRE